MEPTSSSENARQSRGLARFWPSHGMTAPVQRRSDEDRSDEDRSARAAENRAARAAAAAGKKQEEPAETPQGATGRDQPTGQAHAVPTGDTQMVALGSRTVPETLMGTTNGRGWNVNQGGFSAFDAERGQRNGDIGPRDGGTAVPKGLPPAAAVPLPPARPAFQPPPGTGNSTPTSPAGSASPFGSASRFAPPAGNVQAPGPQPVPYPRPQFGPLPAESPRAHTAEDEAPVEEPKFAPGRFGQPLGRADTPGHATVPVSAQPPAEEATAAGRAGVPARHDTMGRATGPTSDNPLTPPARGASGSAAVPVSGSDVPSVTNTSGTPTASPVEALPALSTSPGAGRGTTGETATPAHQPGTPAIALGGRPTGRPGGSLGWPGVTMTGSADRIGGPAESLGGLGSRLSETSPLGGQHGAPADLRPRLLDAAAPRSTDPLEALASPVRAMRGSASPVSGTSGTPGVAGASAAGVAGSPLSPLTGSPLAPPHPGSPAAATPARPTSPSPTGMSPTGTTPGAASVATGTVNPSPSGGTSEMSSPAGPATAALPADSPVQAAQPDRALPTVVTPPNQRPAPDDDGTSRRHSQNDGGPGQLGADETATRRHTLEDDEAGNGRSLDEARNGRSVQDTPARGDGTPLRPGDIRESHISFWDEEATRHFRSEWHEVKAGFVDDPVAALTRAHDLLTDAVNELTESLLAERDELDPLHTTATPDTESMRMAMRGYREFLDRILAL